MKKGLVSIIMPSYNSEKYISESIDSILKQKYTQWELLIIDDCSTDNTRIVVNEYLDKYKNIKYIILEKNSGPSVARNKGIELSEGEYIAFLDSDDLWKENKLTTQVKLMEINDWALSFSEYEEIDDSGNFLNIKIKIPSNPIGYYRYLLSTPIGCLTAMYSVKKLGKVYFPNLRNREDTGLWLKILKKELAYPILQSLAYYRIRNNSITANKIKLIKYHWKLYFKIEKLGYIKSIFFILSIIFVKVFKLKEEKLKNGGIVR